MLAFRLIQVFGRIAAQIRGEKLDGLGDGHPKVGCVFDADAEALGTTVQQMAATLMVIGQEVEMVSGNVYCFCVLGCPETKQYAGDVVEFEQRLFAGCFNQRLTALGFADRADGVPPPAFVI